MTDWHAWSRIVEAAQDPRHRDAVQQFLAQADLSAELPAALDEKFLAPRRPAQATGEQCAYLLCNLGFAALVTGTRQAAEFAMACGQVANGLAPGVPDLELRHRFLSAKGTLVVAMLANQPHRGWDRAMQQCAAYLCAIDSHLETLPSAAVEGNATAACAFAAKALARVADFGAGAEHADAVAAVVAAVLQLEDRLPPALLARMQNTLIPGTDARVLFRDAGASAERALAAGDETGTHAARGLGYADAALELLGNSNEPQHSRLLRTRAELLLLCGRDADAAEVANRLADTASAIAQHQAALIDAKIRLESGDAQAAMERLELPSAEQAVEAWRARWTGDAGEGDWTQAADAAPGFDDIRDAWLLQARAAAALQDGPAVLGALERVGGFLADSLRENRREWTERLRAPGGSTPSPGRQPGDAPAETRAAPGELLDELGDGTALLSVARSDEGYLSLAAIRRAGETQFSPATHASTSRELRQAFSAWSRAHASALPEGDGSPDTDAAGAAAFDRLLDAVARTWNDTLAALLDGEVSQLLLLGDDIAGLPLHAARTGNGDERWIDRLPITYAPSLSVLRASSQRPALPAPERKGAPLAYLGAGDMDALAGTLGSQALALDTPGSETFRERAAAARVLHLSARLEHNALRPFESSLWLDGNAVPLADLFAALDLPQGELVSGFACEAALPSPLRAPGFDLPALLLAAGARNVLASSWATGDGTAADMTQRFFAHWVAGEPPAAAFRQALGELRAAHPSLPDHRWAGLRLVGAP